MALAIEKLGALIPKTGVALAAVTHSHHCGAAGYHVEALAKQGLIGLMFPRRLPHGAARGECSVLIQSPLRRRASKKTLVIDMSLSKVARGKIPVSSQQGHPIPEGWVLDDRGKGTKNPDEALIDTMLPIGVRYWHLVEVLVATLTSSRFGFEASFFHVEGSPPGVGQLLMAIAPEPISNGQLETRFENLIDEIFSRGDTHVPGDRRQKLREKAYQNGISLTDKQYQIIKSLIA